MIVENNKFNAEFCLIWKRIFRAITYFIRYNSAKKLVNLLLIEYERMIRKKCIKGFPYFIKVDVTNQCDLGCKCCIRQNLSYPSGAIDNTNFKRIIDINRNYVYMVALHFLGEPLFNNNIYDMIGYAHHNKIATYISTNLQNFKEEDARKLILSGLDLLTISLDGASEQTYKRYRKRGNLDKVFKNIDVIVKEKKKLKKRYPEINIQFMVMEHNEHEINQMKKIAADLGVDTLEFKPLGTFDRSLLPQNNKYIRRVYKRENLKRRTCWWLWSAMVILWDGRVIPCCMAREIKSTGNLFKQGIDEVKNDAFYQELRTTVRLNNKAAHEFCKDCIIPYGNFMYQTI